MKRQIKIWGSRTFVVALLVVAVSQWGMPAYKQYMVPKKKTAFVPTAKVQAGKFTISFHEIGTLEAEKSVPVLTETGGKIIKLVQEGKVVVAGERLVEMDTTDLLKEVRNQKLNYQNALADVNRVQAELDILKESNKTDLEKTQAQQDFDLTELERAENTLDKKTRLAEEKLISGSEVDQAKLDVRAKKLAVLKGTKDLALKKKEIESKEQQKLADVRNKEFAANMAKFNLDDATARVSRAIIKAPASGMVVITKDWFADGQRKLQEGDAVRPRQIICQLPNLSSMQVKIKVGESDAPRLKVGLPVMIRLDAIPGKIFHGAIKDISSLATESNPWEGETPGRKQFEVVVAVKEVDPKTLKPGITADAEFICESVKKAVYVPIESVIEKDGKTLVYVKRGKRYERVMVKTGKQNDNFVCITKGLKNGEVVALRDPTKPLDEQESGTANPADNAKDKKKEKSPAPIPGATKS
ncbi:MAG: efflux RND transporter periplasmic adaptor subunit [Armatimonadota bacterium]|nr:efflux RND transporter periplasmic adaptor subunit [bacterium]